MNSEIEGRDVGYIISEILKIIPPNQIALIYELKAFNKTLWNQSPESRKTEYCWAPVQNILNKHIQNLDEEWQINLQKLFNNSS